MPTFVADDQGKFSEWQKICNNWGKPADPPTRKLDDLTDDDIAGKILTTYSKNTERKERDYALIRPPGTTTPTKGTYFWVSGANGFLDEKYPDTA